MPDLYVSFVLCAAVAVIVSLFLSLCFVDSLSRGSRRSPGARRIHQEVTPRLGARNFSRGPVGIAVLFLLGVAHAISLSSQTALNRRRTVALRSDSGRPRAARYAANFWPKSPSERSAFLPDSESKPSLPSRLPISLGLLHFGHRFLDRRNHERGESHHGLERFGGRRRTIAFAAVSIMAVLLEILRRRSRTIAAGATIAFLRSNYSPAKISWVIREACSSAFAGDSFAVGIASRGGGILLVPIFFLAYPIVDTMVAILRRSIRSTYVRRYAPTNRQSRILSAACEPFFRPTATHSPPIAQPRFFAARSNLDFVRFPRLAAALSFCSLFLPRRLPGSSRSPRCRNLAYGDGVGLR